MLKLGLFIEYLNGPKEGHRFDCRHFFRRDVLTDTFTVSQGQLPVTNCRTCIAGQTRQRQRKVGDIACSENACDIGLKKFVDNDVAARIQFDV